MNFWNDMFGSFPGACVAALNLPTRPRRADVPLVGTRKATSERQVRARDSQFGSPTYADPRRWVR